VVHWLSVMHKVSHFGDADDHTKCDGYSDDRNPSRALK
jgi:hypothetical protein